MNITKPLSSS